MITPSSVDELTYLGFLLVDALLQEYETKIQEMQEKFDEEQSSKAKLQVDIDQMKQYYEEKLTSLEEKKSTGKREYDGPWYVRWPGVVMVE